MADRDPILKNIVLSLSISAVLFCRIYFLKRQEQLKEAEERRLHEEFLARHSESTTNTNSFKSNSFVGLFGKERKKVIVQVPATSANLGCGYDCLGMALDMWNELVVERAEKFEITAEGDGCDDLPLDETNYVIRGLTAAFKHIKKPVPALKYHLIQRIPHGRGLGSSSAAIVAGLVAGFALAGEQISVQGSERLLQLATEIEGHPDNVAPCMYGGVQLGIYNETERRWETERLRLPHGLKFIMFIPNFTGKTEELRKVVPKTVPLADVVFNMGRIAWLVNALNTGKLSCLREAFRDRLHQPYRAAVYKHLYPLMDAALAAGALGSYLSGAGPVVMSVTSGGAGDYFTQQNFKDQDLRIAEALSKEAERLGVKGKVYITHPSDTGAVVTYAEPAYSNELVSFNGET